MNVTACLGLCVEPAHIKSLTYQLLTIAESRKSILFDNPCEASRKAVEENEIKTVSYLVTSLAIYTRLWFDAFSGDVNGEIPNPKVCKRIDKSGKHNLRQTCSFIAHGSGMYFMPCDDQCSGNDLIFLVPKGDHNNAERVYCLDIRKFCCAINEVVDFCPECGGEQYSIAINEDGTPIYQQS